MAPHKSKPEDILRKWGYFDQDKVKPHRLRPIVAELQRLEIRKRVLDTNDPATPEAIGSLADKVSSVLKHRVNTVILAGYKRDEQASWKGPTAKTLEQFTGSIAVVALNGETNLKLHPGKDRPLVIACAAGTALYMDQIFLPRVEPPLTARPHYFAFLGNDLTKTAE